MRYSSANRGLSVGNPIANLFVIVVGALVIAVSVVLGFVAFVVLGSIVMMLASVVGIRLWWFNRKLGGQSSNSPTSGDAGQGGVIEGEFKVLDNPKDDSDHP